MEYLHITTDELKEITIFLNKNKIVHHPFISPSGEMNFRDYQGRNFTVLIDRNILTQLIKLVSTGELKDDFSRKAISSLMLWAHFNNISINSGIALSEHAYNKQGNDEAGYENNLFKKAFNHYEAKVWLDLSVGKIKSISRLNLEEFDDYDFHKEYDHYKMHQVEMLKIAQIYFNDNLSIEEKFESFYRWVYDEFMICKYTVIYFALLLSGRIHSFNKEMEFLQLVRKCKNQAWDLSYLSLWSTLYHQEENPNNMIFLFGTLDKGLKEIMSMTHKNSDNIFYELFSNETGKKLINIMSEIYKRREPPLINSFDAESMIKTETEALRKIATSNSR